MTSAPIDTPFDVVAARDGSVYVSDLHNNRIRRIAPDGFIYELAQNSLIAPTMEAQWIYTQRVMGEVLMRDEKPRDIWDQHEAMLAKNPRMGMQLKNLNRLSQEQREAITAQAKIHRVQIQTS